MAILIMPAKRVRKTKTRNSQEVLSRLQEFLEQDAGTGELVSVLCGFWEDQQSAISYQELRQIVMDGTVSKEMLQLWSQDYSKLVANTLSNAWMGAARAGISGQPIMDGISFEFNTQKPGILNWIGNHGAEFVTSCTEGQKNAVEALLTKKMVEGHTVDELSRMIRPCIGLTEGQAKANARFYDNMVETLKKEHPRMKDESIQRKAQEAAMKYAERQHRYRAMTIAQTESAFAYNRGADEGIRQAQEQNLIGKVIKRWSTSGDDQVCGICQGFEGMEVEMDKGFPFKGKSLFPGQDLLPPAHPRCACAVEYIEVENQNEMLESPMRLGDEMLDRSIDDYDASLVNTNGDEAMSVRLLMSHDEVKYEKNETLDAAFAYDGNKDIILYNPKAKNVNDYDMMFVLTHENAHRVDYLFLHSWENENFLQAMNNLESLIMSNLAAVEKLLQEDGYGNSFAFNDLISSLTRGKANDILFIGHDPDYLSNESKRAMEVFADVACIDMGSSVVKKEFEGLLKELYKAYKEVASWKT